LLGAIPYVGNDLLEWIRGDYYISDVTLNRFFALHVIALPLALVFLVVAHLVALHEVGSNNPDGIEINKLKNAQGNPVDGIPLHPYYTVKDLMGVAVFALFFCAVVFFAPTLGGLALEHANFEEANRLQTPEEIAPVWYFTPYYAILRAVPNKLFGVLLMGAAVLAFFFLPWLDRSKVKSIRYRGWLFKGFLFTFAASFIALGYLGLKKPTPELTNAARVFTAIYFAFFALMPWYSKADKTKPVPERVTYHAH
jgi:ubiquinol-cytochrome c reductase cytochrome b subunit